MAVLGLHCCVGFSLVQLLLWSVDARAHGLQEWHMDSGVAAPGLLSISSTAVTHGLPSIWIFLVQGLNSRLLHRQVDALPLSQQASSPLYCKTVGEK